MFPKASEIAIAGLFGVLAAVVVVGCERRSSAPTAASSSTAPATIPATQEDPIATSRPAFSLINVNGHSTVFPAARLRIERDSDHLVAILFSDDPKEALKDNYIGNSFYLRMDLDINDPAELGATEWLHKTPSSATHEDTPYGLFLSGRKTQLTPFDVHARFRRDNRGDITVLLAGQFQIVDTSTEHGPAQVIAVGSELAVLIDKMPSTAP